MEIENRTNLTSIRPAPLRSLHLARFQIALAAAVVLDRTGILKQFFYLL